MLYRPNRSDFVNSVMNVQLLLSITVLLMVFKKH